MRVPLFGYIVKKSLSVFFTLYFTSLKCFFQISMLVREKKKGGENMLAVRFENIPKGTKERLPLEKCDIRKAVIEMGGTDRDTAYFTVPGETIRKNNSSPSTTAR